MAIRNSRDPSRELSSKVAATTAAREKARKAFRRSLLETLEGRALMAVGPQLIGIQPNNSDLIENGVVREVAPRELTFRFDDSQMIDAATTSGIRFTRSGGDGTFGLASAATDFGSNGRVDIQLTLRNPGQTLTVNTTKVDRGNSLGPALTINGTTLSIVLNSNSTSPTTAAQLVNAINSTSGVSDRISAKINGGFADTKLGLVSSTIPSVSILSTNDTQVLPGSVLVGSTPNENEVTVRFSESLADDFYRIEVFGFDDTANGIIGLRNVATPGMPAQFFQPTKSGTRQDTIDFRLDLGSQVTGVVPQPVVRNANGSILQRRNEIVVYFDSDKLLVENDSAGAPTTRSAENPDFYQLIYTADTVRSGDDATYKPTTVRYNASNNSATLTFNQDIDSLRPAGKPRAAFRLRIGTRETIPFQPNLRTVNELGDTVTTADNLGVIGSSTTPLTSVILTSDITTTALELDRLGASDDPGHRDLGNFGFENHINERFGVDTNPGITKVFYNFRTNYVTGLTNSINERQKERVREALQIWSNYLGIQFTESSNQGLTFSTGVLSALSFGQGIQSEPNFNYRVRIDPTFNNGLLIMDAGRAWNDNFGEDYFRITMTAIGMMLGLEHAGDLPDSTLLSMNNAFLNAPLNSTSNFEPIFPGAQDILHGRFIHRPDNSDVDLYRFEVDFGANGAGRVGEFVAETFAERSQSVSGLDTNLQLYKQIQATAVSNFNAVEDLAIEFTAKATGQLGNHLQIVVTQSPRGAGALPAIQVSANRIDVELNSTIGSETTAGQLITAITGNVQASALVSVVKRRGADSIKLGNREIIYSPIELLGGKLELIARNDDYFSEDSLLRLALGSGVYYVGVSDSGNRDYNPALANSGTGGRTEGQYELRITFRAQTDSADSIQDTIGQSPGDLGRSLDGDGDGLAGGIFNFWFETRSLQRVLSVTNSGQALDGQIISITGSTGIVRRFELTTDASVGNGNIPVPFTLSSTPSQIASALASAIHGQALLGVTATVDAANTHRVSLSGDRIVQFSLGATGIEAEGKTIFVDKLAGPNADGSEAKPFNNLQNAGVPNAFGSTLPGDIVRIVGNGGTDGSLATIVDNFAYEFGYGLLPGATLTDGIALELPKGIIAMVDSGVVFKSRRSYIGVGSSNTGIDRSGSSLQILGTPLLPVYFTSWLDETIGRDSYGPTTTPTIGDWGGILYQRDVDRSQGRIDKEDQGIFLNYVNRADMRYGGGGGIVINANQQVVNPIQVTDGRPTLTFNSITLSADAPISATPNSFEETLFTDLRFQNNGSFTPDYDRVGPDIHGNRLIGNSLNGLFIKSQTLAGEAPRAITTGARFDDIDITHIFTENLVVQGTPGGSLLDRTVPDTTFMTLGAITGGNVAAGIYNYRVTFIDRFGAESVPSSPTNDLTLAAAGAISVTGIPALANSFSFVRVYRSDATGAGQYSLVAQLDATQNSFVDRGQDLGGRLTIPTTPVTSVLRPRLDASLVIDPGTVMKIEGARIELGQGVQFLAEGTGDLPVIFTSKLDDRWGAGGTFDTNNDSTSPSPSLPAPGNWGGIYVSNGADISIDHSVVAYAGGVTRLEGTFRAFNTLELQQATARVANTTFEFSATGVGGQGPSDRFGRLGNEPGVVLIRGSSPIFINNTFLNNSTNTTGFNGNSPLSIDANSLNNELQGDRGRQTSFVDRLTTMDNNRGPLFRGNSFSLNDLNGLEIRADNRSRNTNGNTLSIEELPSDGLTVESVWDDTDIVHVIYEGIFVSNLAHESGLRLQSSATESLVIKASGGGSNFDPLRGTGFTAGGFKSSIDDRVGGTIYVVGQPGFPVILTSLQDDTVGAGLRPDGKPQNDTNNDGIESIPQPGDWRGILLDQNSNDRNVAFVPEIEAPNAVAPGVNGSVLTAQVIGQLATNGNDTDENQRLGFVIKGVLSQPEDVDTYSFTGVAGTEVWIDVDHTALTLDTVIELLDANGNLLARSDNSTDEVSGISSIVTTPGISSERVNPLAKQVTGNIRRHANNLLKEDGTTNPRDAGLRVVLPGVANTRSGYFFRIRSASIDPSNFSAGLTGGSYEVQVRLREAQEFAGSLVTVADIRYATNGIHLRGLPAHSPLLGEIGEDESVRTGNALANNDTPWSYQQTPFSGGFFFQTSSVANGNRPQYVGNILKSDRGVISVAGNLTGGGFFGSDVDFYRFSLNEEDLVSNVNSVANLVFDIDYADGLNRADTNLAVYRINDTSAGAETWELIYFSEGSNIADDQRAPLSGSTPPDFSRGSLGTSDPFINTQALTEGEYLVAVSAANSIPSEFSASSRNILLNIPDVQITVARTIPIDLTTVLSTSNPTLEFSYQDFPFGGNGYNFTINGVTNNIRGNGNFFLDLSLFAGTIVTVVFPAVTAPALPNPPQAITGFLVTNDGVGSGAERTPFARLSTPQLDNLFSNSLSVATRQEVLFDLSGYTADDLPAAYFSYSSLTVDYAVSIDSATGNNPAVFSSGPLVTDGINRQAKIDLQAYAGQSNLKLIFTPTGLNPSATVSRIIVGFAERGESIRATPRDQRNYNGLNGLIQPLFVSNPNFSTGLQSGPYQLEIRRVDTPVVSDTNDRDASGFALIVPNGSSLADGATFQVSDGSNRIEFEFNSSGGFVAGRVPINFVASPTPDSAAVIARRIRDAINSSGVQSRLRVQAAAADGTETGTQTGARVNLFGAARVTGLFSTSNANLLVFSGSGDLNGNRDQGQVVVSGNFIRHSRDYGVWSEAGLADYDPRDLDDTYSSGFGGGGGGGFGGSLIDDGSVRNASAIIQSRPRLVGSSPGPVRNLQELNDDLIGGFSTGVVITNNVLEYGGLGGVHLAGENPIWMISPSVIPPTDNLSGANSNDSGTHFGSFVNDGDQFFIDSGRTRVGIEFEDIAGGGAGTPNFGSGTTGGDGWRPTNVPAYYREDTGSAYLRNLTLAWGYSALETVHGLRDAVMGSILVTNGTTQNVTATVGMSLLDRDPDFERATFGQATLSNDFGLNWANRPALFLEGVTNIYYRGERGNRIWDIRRVDRAESSQPFARIVNNTVIGNDGRASFGTDIDGVIGGPREPNDILANSVPTNLGTTNISQSFTVSAEIGDNPALADPTTDVDFYRFNLNVGERIRIDVDSNPNINPVDTLLQLFDANGQLVNLAGLSPTAVFSVDTQAAPGEGASVDPYIDYTATTTGVFYAAVSAFGNIGFDPRTLANRLPGSSTGDYTIQLALTQPLEVTSPNDTLVDAVRTRQGTSINPKSYSIAGEIGDNARLNDPTTDVDLYQFKLDIGDRVRIDIDTVTNPNPAKSAVDTVLQIYDASGRLVDLAPANAAAITSIDDARAPGEPAGIDPYIDFTAKVSGIYYASVSAKGNIGFDPQSSQARQAGSSVGLYSFELTVSQPNEFTITVEDPVNYTQGDTFTIDQVSDLPGNQGTSRTFEFTFLATHNGPNIPIFIGPDYKIPDVARAIAISINNAGLNNNQNLANGSFGTASPLDPVSAVALGGIDGVQSGLRLFPFRNDGNFVNPSKHSFQGIGHNPSNAQGGTGSEAFGQAPFRADGLGTSEKFVVVRNAASIASTVSLGSPNRRSIQVDPDIIANYNMNQLIPESGILITAGASPTVLNNVFYNVQTPIVKEETQSLPNINPLDPFDQDPIPFGVLNPNAADRNAKPPEIIIGGNVYQFIDTQFTFNRNGYGIQASPTNIPNTQADFNFVAGNTDILFANPQTGNFLPANGSRLIDSSIDSLTERSRFNSIKSAVGIAAAPVFAPTRDAVGLLRVDDPTVSPPQGLGANVFKDRGALERADFVGPSAILLLPIDNDSALNDRDPSISYVQLTDGTFPEFRLQLVDSGDAADPFPGLGIDDNSVLGPDDPPRRLTGAVLTISEDGRTLREGIDYVFAYNPTTKEIVLTPLAGVWRNDRVYEIKLNNRDRFVVQAPSGDQVNDGDRFQITDSLGGVVHFEYESGYRLQVPTSLRLQLPISGGGAGGVLDGDRFTISIGTTNQTFEMDRNGNSTPGNFPILFLSTDSRDQLADKIIAAILAAPSIGLSPRKLADGSIFLGVPSGATLNTTGVAFSVPLTTAGLRVPVSGPLPGGVTDGQLFTISDGIKTVTFEIDSDNISSALNQRVDTSASSTASDVADQLLIAILAANLNLQPVKVGLDSILLGLPTSGTVSLGTSQLLSVGVAKTITDTQTFVIDFQPTNGPAITKTFEFDSNGSVVAGNIPIAVSSSLTEDDIGILVAQAISNAGLSLNARHLGSGNIAVGGTTQHLITINQGTELALFGLPGTTASTSIDILGTLVLAIPTTGGALIADGSVFSITNANQSVLFEFDSNNLVGIGNTRIPFLITDTNLLLAAQIAAAIQTSTLGITPVVLPNGKIDLGYIADTQLIIQPSTGLTTERGRVRDGETFVINNGLISVTFEYDNSSLNNGRTTGNVPILYSNGSSLDQVAVATSAAILGAGLGVSSQVIGTKLSLDDNPRFTYNLALAPSLLLAGIPGGAVPVSFVQDSSFTGENMQTAIVKAINASQAVGDTSLKGIVRIGDTFFVENAVTFSSNVSSYFLRGIEDRADNDLRPNRINNETQFTILMPGAALDFGDAPDPFTTTAGRYPTKFSSNGARHVLAGDDEVQVVGWTAGDPVTGTFTLTHGGQTTASLPIPSSAVAVQAALESLSTIGTGNVLVELLEQPSGSANVSYRVTFAGLKTALNVPQTSIALNSTSVNLVPVATFEQTTRSGVSGLRLGTLESADSDGQPTTNADADSGDDGVSFSSTIVSQPGLPTAGFNRNVATTITVTASAPGLLDAWIDFNFDGDWDDPEEQIAQSVEFLSGALVKTFQILVPANAPVPSVPTLSMARFRMSTEGGLLPTGLATNGEVEDYAVTIVPGTPPVAVDDQYTTVEEVNGGFNVSAPNGILKNDTDIDSVNRFVVDNDPNVAGVQPRVSPQNGTLTLNADGSFSYQPNANFFGVDTFVYQASDGVLRSVLSATVTITVSEINDFPTVPDRRKVLEKNQIYDVTQAELLLETTDVPPTFATAGPANESSQTLTITRVDATSVRGGTVTLSGGRIRYTPPLDSIVEDSFTFLVTDNGTTNGSADPLTTTGTIFFTFTDRNSAPVPGADSLTVAEDTSITQPGSFFKGNDVPGGVSESGQTLTITGVDATSTRGGTVTRNGESITYQPPANFNGTDTFFYTITDNGQTNGLPDPRSTKGTVTVTVTSVNDVPQEIAPLGSVTVAEDAADRTFDLKTVFSDVDIATNGDALSYSIFSNNPSTLVTPTIGSNGILTIDFQPDQNGTANVVIRATDKAGATKDSTLAVTVTAVSDAPRLVANVPDQNIVEDTPPIVLTVSPNFLFDPDVATNGDTFTITAVSNNTGLVTTSVVGGTLTLTLVANQSGLATITVRGVDSSGQAISDVFDVNVTAVNDAPTTLARSYSVPANGSLLANDVNGLATTTINDNSVLVGASDVEGDSFNAVIVGQPTRGTLVMNPNGTFTYTPASGSTSGQSDTFTYRAVDARGTQGAVTTVTLNFTALNASSHQNQTSRHDVNADGFVSPVDALIVINFISRNGSNVPISSLTYTPAPYRDVNGDFFIAPIDVLQVLNELNRRSRSSGGEGELGSSAPMLVSANSTDSSHLWSENIGVARFNQVLSMRPVDSISTMVKKTSPEHQVDSILADGDEVEELVSAMVDSSTFSTDAVDMAFVDLNKRK